MSVSETEFSGFLERGGFEPLRREAVTTLQVNLTRRCNLACHHCHVESGPKRTEALDARGVARVLELLERNPQVESLDLTGGAPELHPQFRELVAGARALGRHVVDRCNLTVLYQPGQEGTAEFLAAQGMHVVASLPCYTLETVERQRGRGVFGESIDALRWLNRLGYGRDPSLRLDLVYNPTGPSLPPEQATLEARYREELRALFAIEFDQLLTITNMPIKRFAHDLRREGMEHEYQALLVNHFNPATLPELMCRRMLSVAFDGRLYDCDFNQMLALDLPGSPTIYDLDDLSLLAGASIATDAHCFGCTAGAGSSCGGSLT